MLRTREAETSYQPSHHCHHTSGYRGRLMKASAEIYERQMRTQSRETRAHCDCLYIAKSIAPTLGISYFSGAFFSWGYGSFLKLGGIVLRIPQSNPARRSFAVPWAPHILGKDNKLATHPKRIAKNSRLHTYCIIAATTGSAVN